MLMCLLASYCATACLQLPAPHQFDYHLITNSQLPIPTPKHLQFDFLLSRLCRSDITENEHLKEWRQSGEGDCTADATLSYITTRTCRNSTAFFSNCLLVAIYKVSFSDSFITRDHFGWEQTADRKCTHLSSHIQAFILVVLRNGCYFELCDTLLLDNTCVMVSLTLSHYSLQVAVVGADSLLSNLSHTETAAADQKVSSRAFTVP